MKKASGPIGEVRKCNVMGCGLRQGRWRKPLADRYAPDLRPPHIRYKEAHAHLEWMNIRTPWLVKIKQIGEKFHGLAALLSYLQA
jgi:hypothetical protein